MKTKHILFFQIFVLVFCFKSFAQDINEGPGGSVTPVSVNMSDFGSSVQTNILRQIHERGTSPDQDQIDRLRKETLPFNPNDKSVIEVLPSEQTDAPIFVWNSWYGPNYNGWVPADVDIAKGPLNVMVVTNEQFHIYSSTTFALSSTSTLQTFFTPVGSVASIFDPKVVYDVWANRFVMLALGRNAGNTESYYYLAVSQTNNATGSWWLYRLNAHVNGSTTTALWADYPGLGYSYPIGGSGNVGCIAISTNQYTNGNAFQYGKIRLLKASQLYTGAAVTWYDFWNFQDVGGSTAFTPQVARQPWSTTGAAIFVMNTKSGGGNVLNTRRVDNPTAVTPTLIAAATTAVTAYTPPPPAPSLGGTGTVDAFDCRTQNVYYMNGQLYTAFVSTFNFGVGNNAIVQYVRINSGTNALTNENRFGGSGQWFMHPSVAPEYKNPFTNGYAGIAFSVSSSTIYPNFSVIGYDGAVLSSYSSVNGTGYLGNGFQRFGDYSGITIDNNQNGVFWASGMLARAGSWGTGVFRYAFTAAPVGIHNNNGEIPSSYVLSQNYPNPFNPSTQISFGLPKASSVKITVYDMLGKEVATLVNEYKAAGNYTVDFDASSLSSGAYIYKLSADDFTETKKMILSK